MNFIEKAEAFIEEWRGTKTPFESTERLAIRMFAEALYKTTQLPVTAELLPIGAACEHYNVVGCPICWP